MSFFQRLSENMLRHRFVVGATLSDRGGSLDDAMRLHECSINLLSSRVIDYKPELLRVAISIPTRCALDYRRDKEDWI